jgi:hypothetical protein
LLSGHFARLDYRFSVAVRRSDFGSSEKRHIWLCARSKIIHYCVSEAGRRLSLLKVDTTPALQHLPSGTSIAKLSWLSAWHIRDETGSKRAKSTFVTSPNPECSSTPTLSDQYAPFHTKVITATVRDATHVLDGLLYRQSDLQIEEHYTDTAGFTDHVFALCHLLGFRFALRIRDLADRRLYVPDKGSTYPALGNLIGGTLSVRQMAAQWKEILLSAVR